MRAWMPCLAAGIVAFHQLPSLPPRWFYWTLAAVALLSAWRRLHWLGALALGFLVAALAAQAALSKRLPQELERVDLPVVGEVVSIPEASGRRLRFDFEVSGPAASPLVGARLRLSWYGDFPEVRAGDLWRFTVRLKRPNTRLNPGGFDYERYLFANGIHAVGYVRPDPAQRLGEVRSLARLRGAAAERLRDWVSIEDSKGLVLGLAVGDRAGIDAAQWDVLRATGTSHLMAISGLHIGLMALVAIPVATFGWRRLPGLCERVPAQVAGALAALPAAAGYAALAGFSLPTQRALVMLAVALCAIWLRRTIRPWQGMALALVAVLLYDPLAPLSPGFWLSFGAVGVILAVSLDRPPAPKGRRMLSIQLAISLALLPMTLLWFGDASLVSPLANLVAIPAATLIVPVVLLGTVLLPFGEAVAGPVLDAAAYALHWLMIALAALAELQPSGWTLPPASGWPLALAFGAVGLLVLPRAVPGRWLALPLIVPLLTARPERPEPGALWLTVLDVGQGLAAVAQTHSHLLVYDTGPSYGADFDAGAAVVVPFLRYSGYRDIDALVVSHADTDHAGGVDSIAAEFPVGALWHGEPLRGDHQGVLCRRGQRWEWDGVVFEFLWPDVSDAKGNNASCVLRIVAGDQSVLLTGDIERPVEAELVRSGVELASTVVVAPHHGSASSSSAALVDQVRPRHTVFSMAYLNRWGFPREEVVSRYRAVGSRLWRTDRGGAIQVRLVPGQDVRVEAYREAARRYFHLHADL